MSVKLRLYYYNVPNFGDILSPLLVERLSGRKVACSHPKIADLTAVGSVLFSGGALFVDRRKVLTPVGLIKCGRKILDAFIKPLHIWGSGFLYDPKVSDVIHIRKTKVCAVRGRKTLEILARCGFVANKEMQSISLGDPGLLYPMLLDDAHPVKKANWDVGVVPHFLDLEAGTTFAQKMASKGRRVKLINVNNPDPLQTVADIGSCNEIYSSSLHGLIIADAFGIPNKHVVFSNLGQSAEEAQFKFEDYYSAWRADIPKDMSVMPRDVYDYLRQKLLESFPLKGHS